MSKIAGIYYNDTAAGPGWSVSVYFSGCDKHCPGCHNPEAQNKSYGEEFTENTIQKILSSLTNNGVHRHLSILGGEPCAQYNIGSVLQLCKEVKKQNQGTLIYLWTGFTYEELLTQLTSEQYTVLSHNIDYLIDGPYIESQRNITLPLRGSENQKIYHIKHILNDDDTIDYQYEDVTAWFGGKGYGITETKGMC